MRKLKHYLMIPIHMLRILRAMFILWFLKKVTHPEIVPLVVYGRYVAHINDVILVNSPSGGFLDLGEVVSAEPNFRENYETVLVRLYRRPS